MEQRVQAPRPSWKKVLSGPCVAEEKPATERIGISRGAQHLARQNQRKRQQNPAIIGDPAATLWHRSHEQFSLVGRHLW